MCKCKLKVNSCWMQQSSFTKGNWKGRDVEN